MSRFIVSVVVLAASVVLDGAPLVAASAAEPQKRQVDLGALLASAGRHVVAQVQGPAVLVADERYTQETYDRRSWASSSTLPGATPEQTTYSEQRSITGRREMSSNLVLIPAAESAATAYPWIELRDVERVDGKRVRDRDDRIAQALASDKPVASLRRMSDQAAGFNLHAEQGTSNLPRIALYVLHPANQARFEFKLGRKEGVSGVVLVSYVERGLPSLVAGSTSPIEGTAWIDPRDGTVLKTMIRSRSGSSVRAITVVYRLDPNTHRWVPVEMQERSVNDQAFSSLDGHATYSNFRMLESAPDAPKK